VGAHADGLKDAVEKYEVAGLRRHVVVIKKGADGRAFGHVEIDHVALRSFGQERAK
jgi:hypothetical protein